MELSKHGDHFVLFLDHQEKNVLPAAYIERLASKIVDSDEYIEDIMELHDAVISAGQRSLAIGFYGREGIEQFIVSPLRTFSASVKEKKLRLVSGDTQDLGTTALHLVEAIEQADVYRES